MSADRLEQIGREIRARVDKLNKIGGKAVDMVDSINQLLAEAERLDPDGFAEFKNTHCPELGKSRVYELLAIKGGRKTIEDIRAATRTRVAKYRAAKRDVTEEDSVTTDTKAAKPRASEPIPAPLVPAEVAPDISAEERKALYAESDPVESDQFTSELAKTRERIRQLEVELALASRPLFSAEEFKLIASCLHPDRVADPDLKKKYEEAFAAFNDKKPLLCRAPGQPSAIPHDPEELMRMRDEVTRKRRTTAWNAAQKRRTNKQAQTEDAKAEPASAEVLPDALAEGEDRKAHYANTDATPVAVPTADTTIPSDGSIPEILRRIQAA